MARKRARWKAYQGRIATTQLVFIDETWVKTNTPALAGLGDEGTTAEGLCAPRPLEDLDLHRRAAPRQN